MKDFFNWVSAHEVTTILIVGIIAAICYVLVHRESLFYRE